VTDEEIRAKAGGMAIGFMLDHPEVGPLIRELIEGAIDSTTFENRLRTTNWYKTSSGSLRQWDTLVARDPATAKAQRLQRIAELKDQWAQMGAGPIGGNWEFLSIVENSLRFGWSPEQIRDRIAGQVSFGKGARQGGRNAIDTVRRMQEEYAVPVSTEERNKWAKGLLSGTFNEDGLRGEMARRATSLYGSNKELLGVLQRGGSVREFAEPYLALAAEELGLNPRTMNLRHAKWQEFLTHRRKDGKPAGLSLAEWQRHFRTDQRYGWDNSRTGMEMGAQDAIGIVEMMGMADF
jgi:hypothetical protein